MDTVKQLMAQLKAEEITLDEVFTALRALPWRPKVRMPGLAESYRRADEMPEDNDTFWIELAFTERVIKYDDYKHMIEELAARPHADNPLAAIGELTGGALRLAGGTLTELASRFESRSR